MFEKEDHGGCVELGVDCAEQTDLSNDVVEGLALDEFCQFEDGIFVLDYLVEFWDERVVDCPGHFQLLSDNLHHIVLLKLSFVEQFTDQEFFFIFLVFFVAGQNNRTLQTLINEIVEFDMVVVDLYGFSLHFFWGKRLKRLNRPKVGQTQLNDDAFSLNNDIIFESNTDSFVQKYFAPGLASFSEITWRSEFF